MSHHVKSISSSLHFAMRSWFHGIAFTWTFFPALAILIKNFSKMWTVCSNSLKPYTQSISSICHGCIPHSTIVSSKSHRIVIWMFASSEFTIILWISSSLLTIAAVSFFPMWISEITKCLWSGLDGGVIGKSSSTGVYFDTYSERCDSR